MPSDSSFSLLLLWSSYPISNSVHLISFDVVLDIRNNRVILIYSYFWSSFSYDFFLNSLRSCPCSRMPPLQCKHAPSFICRFSNLPWSNSQNSSRTTLAWFPCLWSTDYVSFWHEYASSFFSSLFPLYSFPARSCRMPCPLHIRLRSLSYSWHLKITSL